MAKGAIAMLPGFNPRELRRLMKRMGIELEEIKDATRVEIHLKDKKIVIDRPQVVAMHSRGETIFQIIGSPHEEVLAEEKKESIIEVSEEDIEFIVSQTGVSREEARKALIEAGGDIAEAILRLQGG